MSHACANQTACDRPGCHVCNVEPAQAGHTLYYDHETIERQATALINSIKRIHRAISEYEMEVTEHRDQLKQKRERLAQLIPVRDSWRLEATKKSGRDWSIADGTANELTREIRHLKQDSVNLRYDRDDADRAIARGERQIKRWIGELNELARRPFGD